LRLRLRFLVYRVQGTMCGHSWTTFVSWEIRCISIVIIHIKPIFQSHEENCLWWNAFLLLRVISSRTRCEQSKTKQRMASALNDKIATSGDAMRPWIFYVIRLTRYVTLKVCILSPPAPRQFFFRVLCKRLPLTYCMWSCSSFSLHEKYV
jgi:hypothetical protein